MRGIILYRGPSMLDRSPIVVVATLQTTNRKTGDMVQVWILPDDGLDPLAAVKAGRNQGACGTCPLQGEYDAELDRTVNRVCYVNLGQAPLAIHRGIQRGLYPTWDRSEHASIIRGRKVRLGAYGDPAAVPLPILRMLCRLSSGWAGYSHQLFWIERDRANKLAKFLMVSCHNIAQHNEAIRRGWRAFTVVRDEASAPAGSVQCPAYTHGITCEQCGLCAGLQRPAKSVWVAGHGKVAANIPNVPQSIL